MLKKLIAHTDNLKPGIKFNASYNFKSILYRSYIYLLKGNISTQKPACLLAPKSITEAVIVELSQKI
jgi:hypothetical protein